MNGGADLWTARNLWTGFLDGNPREFDTQRNLSRIRTVYERLDKYLIFSQFPLSVGFGTSSLMTPHRSRGCRNQDILATQKLIHFIGSGG